MDHSANREKYKYVAGEHFGERKHWLLDDYVKFIRFAQHKIEEQERGVVAVITNHSYLDNPTFRGMRHSLLQTFDQMYFFNLHGNSRRRERAPDGSKDDNVFDIEQGVAVALFVKSGKVREVKYGDVWGPRLEKYKKLAESDRSVLTTAIVPCAPYYFFSPHVPADFSRWHEIWSLEDMFDYSSVGMLTARDALTISHSPEEATATANIFVSLPPERARARFELGKDSRDWSVNAAQRDLANIDIEGNTKRIAYRPFDQRFTTYSGQSRGFIGQPCRPLADTLEHPENIVLITSTRIEIGDFQHVLVVDELSDGHTVASKETNHVFPLYRRGGPGFVENVSKKFREFVDAKFEHHYTPEQVLSYAYAVLHAPEYRVRYADFLRVDYPRVPFPDSRDHFDTLSALGWTLVEAHLLRKVKRRGLGKYLGQKQGEGEHRVDAVRYGADEAAIYINDTQRFAPIPAEVWNFHIGGYQVLDKYLKSRKTRTLSLDEIEHVAKVADVLAFTIEQMAAIDDAYKAAFPQQTGAAR